MNPFRTFLRSNCLIKNKINYSSNINKRLLSSENKGERKNENKDVIKDEWSSKEVQEQLNQMRKELDNIHGGFKGLFHGFLIVFATAGVVAIFFPSGKI